MLMMVLLLQGSPEVQTSSPLFRHQSLLAHTCMELGAGAPSLEFMTYLMTEGILRPVCMLQHE